MPKLVIERPDAAPENFEIRDDSITIGRSPENAIHVDDAACSRRHCQILRISSGFEVTDLKSRNGTKVNGVKKDRAVLKHGDVIEIGAVRLTFREHDEKQAAKAADLGTECRLVFAGGARKGDAIPLKTDRTTLGRKESNTLVLTDTMASSYHCEITREAGGYVLRDLGSTNGSVVNGEPVSEIALNHGARIRIGKTVLVFIDPAVANYEQALAAEEEAEAEWGMMRDQMDFDRVKQARRASLVWGLVFLLILGGAAAFFVAKPDAVKGLLGIEESAVIEQVAGNRIGDFSFEGGEYAWKVAGENSGSSRVGPGAAQQGQAALLVLGPEREGPWAPAEATYDQDIAVVQGKRYEVSAWVLRQAPGTAACAGVQWRQQNDTAVVRTSLTPWAEGEKWARVRTVVTPPPGAQSARVVLLVMAGGSARFDDVVFREVNEGTSGTPAKFEGAGYQFDLGGDGALSVARTGEFVLWNGGPVAVAESGNPAPPEICFRAERAEGQAAVAGHVLAEGGRKVPVTVAYSGGTDRLTIRYSFEATEGVSAAGLAFSVSKRFMTEGATFSGDEVSGAIDVTTKKDGVKKIVLGGSGRRLILSSEEPFRLEMAAGGGVRLCILGTPGSGEKTLDVVYDFTGMQQEARRVLGLARSAKTGGKLGEAIDNYARVVREFPFDDAIVAQATTEMEELTAKGRERLAAARGIYDACKDFYDESDLVRASNEAAKVAEAYAGYAAVAEDATRLQQEAAAALTELRAKSGRAGGEGLLSRAKDFEANDQKGLARLFYGLVASRFPGTDLAAEAEAGLGRVK